MAVGPGNPVAPPTPPRYVWTPGVPNVITVTDAAGLIDLMDPGNVGQVCAPGTVIRLQANINMAAFPLTLNAPDPITAGAWIRGVQIGNNTNPFQGVFDGTGGGTNPSGFVIRNLTIIGDGDRIIPAIPTAVPPLPIQVDTTDGLFGLVQRPVSGLLVPNVAINNLILEAPLITGFATDIGGLVGRLNRGTVLQCCVVGPGDIIAGGNGQNWSLGGLVGRIVYIGGVGSALGDDPTVWQCFATCNVRGPMNVGGLVGAMDGTNLPPAAPGVYVRDSYAADHTVIGAGNPFDTIAPSLGGLVGLNNLGAITTSYADTIIPITGDPTVAASLTPPILGSLVGTWNWANAAVITNFSETIDCPTSVPTGVGAGNQPGYAANAVAPALLRAPATYVAAGWALGVIWTVPQPGQRPRLLWRPF